MMKTRSLLTLCLILATTSVWAQSPGAPGTGIAGTAHDWSRSGDGNCAMCHPIIHQAKSTNLPWSPALSTGIYQWDQPATTAGTIYPRFSGNTYNGPSAQCLRCHDGSVVSMDGVWFNRFVRGHNVASATGNMAGTHPVAAPYPLDGRASAYNGTINGRKINGAEWVADPSVTNDIRLFNDDGTGNITVGSVPGKTGIECPSCHDVHNGSRVKDSFLLTGHMGGTNKDSGGYLCQQCHSK